MAESMTRCVPSLVMVMGLLISGVKTSHAAEARISEAMAGQAWNLPLSSEASLELKWIPPGSFDLGSPATEAGRSADEGPVMHVTLTRGFWLGKTHVTVGQWKAVMGLGVRAQLVKAINDDTLYDLEGRKETLRDLMKWSRTADPAEYLGNEDDDLPMYFVSWTDAMEFARRLTEHERAAGRLPAGYTYSLPTEAQWEYACRAGTSDATFGGPNSPAVLDRVAWYVGNSAANYVGRPVGKTHFGPRAVGQKAPNPWGLCDIYGNIWQWCRDWYGPYPGGSVNDPIGPASGSGRVNRGGSFGSGPNNERSAGRAVNPQPEASAYRGFRLALCPVD